MRRNVLIFNTVAAPAGVAFNPATLGNNGVLTGSNFILTCSSGNSGAVLATSAATGKYYADFKIDTFATIVNFGVLNASGGAGDLNSGNFIGVTANSWGYVSGAINGKRNNSVGGAYGTTVTAGDYVGVAIDLTNGFIYISKNNVWMDSGVPTSGALGTNAMYSLPAGTYRIGANVWAGTQVTKQATSFYSPPVGYTAI